MKLATIHNNGQLVAVFERGSSWVELTSVGLPASIREFLALGHQGADQLAAADGGTEHSGEVRFGPPIPDPEKIICIGLNYRDHAIESGTPIPEEPILFSKYATAVVGPEDEIVLPPVSDSVDYEAELVMVVGREGKNVSQSDAESYIAGYTCGHDVSARDWQLHKPGGQWMAGKTFDTFAPIGPVLVSRDEITDAKDLSIRLRLNGKTMQDSSTKELIFGPAEIIEYLTRIVTLKPGDLIFTGTPPGVGFAMKPPVFLKDGDRCEVEIGSIGVLSNPVVQG